MVDRLLSGVPADGRARPARRRDLMIVGGIAVLLRLAWVAGTARPPAGLSDPILYQGFAIGIARGDGYVSINGFPTSYYPPGYPYLLGAIQWFLNLVGLDGSLHWAAGGVQALLGAFSAMCVTIAAARWFSPRVGMIAGLCLACWPNVIAYSSALLSESLYLAVFAAFLAALASFSPRRTEEHSQPDEDEAALDREPRPDSLRHRIVTLAAAPLLLGVATLVRPQVLLSIPALLLAEMLAGQWRDGLRLASRLGAGVLLVVSPWFIRNLVVLDAPVLVSTNGGDNLCVGFHEQAPGFFTIPTDCDTGEFYIDGPAAEIRRNDETARRARHWALGNLGQLPELSAKKLWYTYQADTDGLRAVEAYEQNQFLGDGFRGLLRIVSNLFYGLAMLVAALGATLLGRRAWRRVDPASARIALTVLALAAAALLVPVIVFGDGRFKVPATPLVAVLVGVGLDAVFRRTKAAGPVVEDGSTQRDRLSS